MSKGKKEKHFIHKPVYPDGIKGIRKFIAKNMAYPKEALTNKIEGTVYLTYVINYKGKVIKTKVISSLGYGCDQEAERLVSMLEFEVRKPRGVKVKFNRKIQIHFRIPKKVPKPKPPAQPQKKTVTYQYQIKQTTTDKKKATSKTYSYTIRIKN